MKKETGLEIVYFCPHDDNQCNCRKPELFYHKTSVETQQQFLKDANS